MGCLPLAKGAQDIKRLILADALFLLDGGRKRRKEKRRRKKIASGEEVFPGLDPPCLLCSRSQVLDAIKG
jgi:hypothetical protein